METRPVILLVGSTCPPEAESELNQWYEKHVWDVLSGGAKRAARYRLVSGTKGENPKYLAIYEFENMQTAEAYDTTPTHFDAVKDMANLGFKVTLRAHYERIGSWEK